MKNRDRISSAAAFIFGAFVSVEGYRLEIGSLEDPGSGFIFFWLGLIIIVLSSIVVVQTLIGSSAGVAARTKFSGVGQLAAIILALVLYAAAFKNIGFVISTLLVMLFLFKVMGSQSWKTAIVAAFLSSVSAYLMFDVWLGCSLPAGLLRIG